MGKVQVGALLGDQLEDRAAKLRTAGAPESGTTCGQNQLTAVAPSPESATDALPKYLRLERKDTRLRVGQIDELARIARRLQRARGRTERITENTLVRVAVDMLLAVSDDLAGRDEEELRQAALRRIK